MEQHPLNGVATAGSAAITLVRARLWICVGGRRSMPTSITLRRTSMRIWEPSCVTSRPRQIDAGTEPPLPNPLPVAQPSGTETGEIEISKTSISVFDQNKPCPAEVFDIKEQRTCAVSPQILLSGLVSSSPLRHTYEVGSGEEIWGAQNAR